MEIVSQPIEYKDGDAVLEAMLCYDKAASGKKLPLVLIFHAWAGRAPFEVEKAQALAKLGYAGFAVDLFGKGVVGSGPEENQKLMAPFTEDRNGLLLKRMKLAIDVALKQNIVDTAKVAAIGFCFGGLCVLDLARNGVDLLGVVSLHGLFSQPPDYKPGKIKSKILALHGYKDPMVPPDQVLSFMQEMSSSDCDWQLHAYGTAGHAFTNKGADAYGFPNVGFESSANARSWQALLNFLTDLFA